MKKPWSKIRKGDVLDLAGREWTVEKIKPGKKKAEVKIRNKGNVVRDTVKLDDKVRLVEKASSAPKKKTTPPPAKQMPKNPPEPAEGNPWETQQDRIERKLDQMLGAKLLGESVDGEKTYYVPPIDLTTVAAHMVIFHGGIGDEVDETVMMVTHAQQHAAAEAGDAPLATVHWHTEKRPEATKGKKR